ncbi:MAG TPA: hypothetical protein VK154_05275 [Chitinophagales bacterium]|nr:hypothetical protein [Chitinophagales bacterium]
MEKPVRYLALILLLFNGIGAVYGGMSFILQPDGSTLGMSLTHLTYSPFSNYTIPGIILLVVNGLLSFTIAAITLARTKYYPLAIIAQGILLVGWLVVQIILLRFLFILHIVMAVVGLLLIATGVYLNKNNL